MYFISCQILLLQKSIVKIVFVTSGLRNDVLGQHNVGILGGTVRSAQAISVLRYQSDWIFSLQVSFDKILLVTRPCHYLCLLLKISYTTIVRQHCALFIICLLVICNLSWRSLFGIYYIISIHKSEGCDVV